VTPFGAGGTRHLAQTRRQAAFPPHPLRILGRKFLRNADTAPPLHAADENRQRAWRKPAAAGLSKGAAGVSGSHSSG